MQEFKYGKAERMLIDTTVWTRRHRDPTGTSDALSKRLQKRSCVSSHMKIAAQQYHQKEGSCKAWLKALAALRCVKLWDMQMQWSAGPHHGTKCSHRPSTPIACGQELSGHDILFSAACCCVLTGPFLEDIAVGSPSLQAASHSSLHAHDPTVSAVSRDWDGDAKRFQLHETMSRAT